MVFPAIIAAYAVCLRAGNFKERLLSSAKLSVPFWCVLAAYLVLRFRMLGSLTTRQRIWGLTSFQVGLNVFHLLAQYWWKLTAPLHLNAYYVFSPVRSIADPRAIAGILFVAIACVAIGYALGRAPLIAFAGLWVFITLLPVMNIYALGRNAFAERYLYLPSVGFCLLVAGVAASIVKRLPRISESLYPLFFSWQSWFGSPPKRSPGIRTGTMTRPCFARLWMFRPMRLLCILWLPPPKVTIPRNRNPPKRTTCVRLPWRGMRIRPIRSTWPAATKGWRLCIPIAAITLALSRSCASGATLFRAILNWMLKRV